MPAPDLGIMHVQERFKHGEGVPSELSIIVGRGHHVQQGGPKLKDTVQQLLQQQLHMNLDQVSMLRPSPLVMTTGWVEGPLMSLQSIVLPCSAEPTAC